MGNLSAHRFLYECADPCLFGGSQLLQREGDRPQGTFVEVRRVTEAERRVLRIELLRGLEEADDLVVLGLVETSLSANQASWMSPIRLPSASRTLAISLPPPTSLMFCSVWAPASRSVCKLSLISLT